VGRPWRCIGRSSIGANGDYQQFTRTTCPQSAEAFSCVLTFGALPAGKNLIVRQVSCFMAVISGGVRYVALESYSATGTAPIARTFISPVLGGGAGFLTATAAATHVVAAGQRLKTYVDYTGGKLHSVECSVVGELLAS
jgi:hypothetical protein